VGIRALPLKGPLLADDVYGHAGLRQSSDVDLLVSREDLGRAAEELKREGYEQLHSEDGRKLPVLHYVLRSTRPSLPTLELHWRIHWYETGFSSGLVERSVTCPIRGRRPAPADDLAALLLFYLRDGFVGLPYAADIAGWWDAHGHELEPNALDPIILAHPELSDGLLTSLAVAETLVGIPAGRLTSMPPPATGRSAAAERLADWTLEGPKDQVGANVTLVDWLVGPSLAHGDFLRRTVFPTRAVIRDMYGLDDDARLGPLLMHAWHPPKLVLRYLVALWLVRGGRRWAAGVPTLR
jgi:hypothetical protein